MEVKTLEPSNPGILGPYFCIRRWIGMGFLLIGFFCLTAALAQTKGPTFHSILTKDLNRLIPIASFSRNDRIYLYTVWTGLQGAHEIKVLWIRPDKKIQETVRIKEKIISKTPTYTSWAYLSFTKGLLNISPFERDFIGPWKAQLFLDGKFLSEYDFSVF